MRNYRNKQRMLLNIAIEINKKILNVSNNFKPKKENFSMATHMCDVLNFYYYQTWS